ncbi:hypothetical protein [Actinoallomurus sp. NPDC052274]|uniref:hypothetical protein n=1 Tax=Actinoallomurus sp. NPDC052274 TaxID=3155420 RepID=UPI0034489083
MVNDQLEALIIQKRSRVALPGGPAGDGAAAARQLDAVLMSVGFKLSRGLLEHLSELSTGTVIDTGLRVLEAVRRQVGDHVRHNVYFRDFPANVPDTIEFWVDCMRQALLDPVAGPRITAQASTGLVNLLDLPTYGRYQHTFEEMLAAHEELIPAAGDRVTVLHLGGPIEEEARGLYLALASSRTPLSAEDLAVLGDIAAHCLTGTQPDAIPVRENRAIINRVRLEHRAPLLIDTVTDVLRLACAASDGDVTLTEPTRFRSFRRAERRALLAALQEVIAAAPAKLGDVLAYAERWKRLGERLHPHEYPHLPHALEVFAVTRGDKPARSLGGRVEAAFAAGDVELAVRLLRSAPGLLFRSLDWLLRTAKTGVGAEAVLAAVEDVAGTVSGRVLLSVREHLQNRSRRTDVARVFVNRRGRAWVTGDDRDPIPPSVLDGLFRVLDEEIQRRLPAVDHLLVDPAVLGVALPLSDKTTAPGFGVLPRGTVTPVDGELLRFFIYWRQAKDRTDFDLSALMLDADYRNPDWVSYTRLTTVGGQHSGDITSAPDGASEFINLQLSYLRHRFVIPQVNVFAGERFEEVAESFFGFMVRDAEQQGAPFEPATVRMKSDLRGSGRVALPLVFMRGEDGRWRAKWLHLFLNGHPSFNRVEGNRVTTGHLVRGIVEREYLRVQYLVDLLKAKANTVTAHRAGESVDGPVTYIGLEQPEDLPDGSVAYTLSSLRDLIPA